MSHLRRRSASRLVSLLLAAPLVLGCRRGADTRAPDNFAAPLAEQLLGGPAELAMFVDVAGIVGDSVYGAVVRRSHAGKLGDSRELRWLLARVDRMDVWVTGVAGSSRDVIGLAVLRSGRIVEADFGPAGLALPIERRVPLASGATMFAVRTRGLPGAMFLIDGSLVLASGAAMAAAERHFTTSRTLPPALDGGRGSLAGVHGRRPALSWMAPSYWDYVEAWSVVWHTGRRDDVVATATFADDRSADEAMDWADELPEVRAERQRRCSALRKMGLDVKQSRRTVSVRVSGIRAVLAAALDDRLCE